MHQDIRQLPPSLAPFPLLMTREEFVSNYQPVLNAMNPAAPQGGMLHSTEGHEFDLLCTENMAKVWTMRATDGGLVIISNGLMLNDAIGYFLTRQPHDPSLAIEVVTNPSAFFSQLKRFHGLIHLSRNHQLSQGMQLALAQWHEFNGRAQSNRRE